MNIERQLQNEDIRKTVAESADSPENEMILAFERLRQPENMKKYVEHLHKAHELHALKYASEYDGGYRVPTKEEITANLEERLKKEESYTDFDYENDGPCRVEPLHLGFEPNDDGKKVGTKGWSLIESHEKGHIVRMEGLPHLPGLPIIPENEDQEYIDTLFSDTIDLNAYVFPWTDEEYQKFLDEGKTIKTKEEQIEYQKNWYRSGGDILERMSQLKNYFGMRGDEVFTKEHLDYAREHYIKDRGFDNMTDLFHMITPEKEERFLEVMNSVGV